MEDFVKQQRFYTAREVADILRVSTTTVYRLIKARELPAMRLGRSFRIGEIAVDDYLARGSTLTESAPRLSFVAT